MTYITDKEREFARKHIDAMNEIVGEDIVSRGRGGCICWARYIVGCTLIGKGLPPGKTARIFGFNHSSMSYWRERMERIFNYPQMYRTEKVMYEKFMEKTSEISLRGDRDTFDDLVDSYIKGHLKCPQNVRNEATRWGKALALYFYNLGKNGGTDD